MKNPFKIILKKSVSVVRYFKGFFMPVKNIILFESQPDFSDNTVAVFNEMLKRGLNEKYEFIWWVKDKSDKRLPQIKNVRYVEKPANRYTAEFVKVLMSAKCIVGCNKPISKYNNKTKYFYLMHGTPIKSVKSYYSPCKRADYCIAQSEYVRSLSASEMGISERKTVGLGYPRNDVLTIAKKDLHNYFKKDFDKIIVWYPTFRQTVGKVTTGSSISLPVIHDESAAIRLNESAKKRKVILVLKPHFAQDVSRIKDLKLSNIVFINDDFFTEHKISSYEFVGSCDALLTDYSSVYYDYTLCDKPIGLIWEDIDEYRKDPGFAVDIDFMCSGGEKIYSEKELEEFIERIACGVDVLKDKRREIKNLVNFSDDGMNAKRVTDFIVEKAAL